MKAVLRNWRKKFSASRVSDVDAEGVYDEGIKRIEEWLAAGRRDDVLAIAANVVRSVKLGGVNLVS